MRKYSGLIVLLLLVIVVFAPVDVPFTIESVAKALPVQQWILFKTPEGSLSATFHNHRSGLLKKSESFQFDRGDVVEIKFSETWDTTRAVQAGETIAVIYSNTLSEDLIKLKNLLAIEKANMEVVATGQKQQFVRQLEEQVNLAKEDLKLQKKTLERTQQMHKDGLVSTVDLELAENAYNESAAMVKVAEKALVVGETGEKDEMLSLSASKIASYNKEIEFLEKTQSKFEITAPFTGQVRFESLLEGDWLYLEDNSSLVLFIPIQLKDLPFLKPGQQVELKLFNNEILVPATVLETGEKVEIIGMDQVVVIKVLVIQGQQSLPSGWPVQCQIRCGDVQIKEFLKRSIKW